MPRIEDVICGRNNNLNSCDLTAAAMVIVRHEAGIAGIPGAVDPFYRMTSGPDDAGALAVVIHSFL